MPDTHVHFEVSRAKAFLPVLVCIPLLFLNVAYLVELLSRADTLKRDDLAPTIVVSISLLLFAPAFFYFFRLWLHAGWVDVSVHCFTRSRLGKTQKWLWSDLDQPVLRPRGRGVTLVGLRVLKTGKWIQLSGDLYKTESQELFDIISAAQIGQLITRDQWRSTHPRNTFESRLLYIWFFVLTVAVLVAVWRAWSR